MTAALQTDLYQLTMAAGYFHRGMASTIATCELFVRRLPAVRRYLLAAGIDDALDYLEGLRFDAEEVDYLRSVPALADAMTPDFVTYLKAFRFRGDVWAVSEGTPMFAGAPLMRVQAPIIEAQIVETHLLSLVNHATMVASKAARIVRAAKGRKVLEFGSRRTHPDEAVAAARAAYLAGAAGTSNLEAGRRFAIPVMGTAAHMWTMTHDSEEQSFENYVATFPNASILLIDTYDTLRGAERAADAAGDKLAGVRLDSGDLGSLSKQVRAVLDAKGCGDAIIVASGDLNEYSIQALLADGAPIDAFGVGTDLVTSRDAPALGGVYKVVQFEREGRCVPIAKLSEGKATYPGPHQVFRRWRDGVAAGDVLALADEEPPAETRPLLEQRFVAGRRSGGSDLQRARRHAMDSLDRLPPTLHELEPWSEPPYDVALSSGLQQLVARVREQKQ